MAVGESYEEFIEKFKAKGHKKNTDDCYTPPEVYDVVKDWVNKKVMPLDEVEIVRPFYPNGDYENYEYPDECLVLDNPPFSILRKIVDFYDDRGIKYFLFAPSLTLFNEKSDNNTCVVVGSSITYENGAKVNTSFVTNIYPENPAFVIAGDLQMSIKEVQNTRKRNDERNKPPQADFDPHFVTAARLLRLAVAGKTFVAPREECCLGKRTLDNRIKPFGRGMFVSDRVADFCKRESQIKTIEFSEREWGIIRELNKKQKDNGYKPTLQK